MGPSEHVLRAVGGLLARYLTKPVKNYSPPATSSAADLRHALRRGDVLLVEGDTRVSMAIKYLTQSTWSHAALYVGPIGSANDHGGELSELVEADVKEGVRGVPLSRYADYHTRICRPVGLDEETIDRVVRYAVERIGYHYDLRNLVDLARYLLPLPPVPVRMRRRLIEFGSGEPTRAICSTLIAQAFQSVRYPILPYVEFRPTDGPGRTRFVDEVLRARHHRLFTPRDFDISPYFRIVKPRIERGFDHRALRWEEANAVPGDGAAKSA